MCVLASAVDIFSSHPSRGGDWLPSWSPPRFVICRTRRHENIYLCVDALKAKEYHHNLILIYMSQDATSQLSIYEEISVSSVPEFLEKIFQWDEEDGTETFYRGHADKDWELLPSIFRKPNGVEKEHLLFRDMVAHEPQSFSECKSTLDYLVQMQHYGLPTRLLDMMTNPLVALYFACEKADSKDGVVYVFSIPQNKVRFYDSKTVSVLANLAKCESTNLNVQLYPKCDLCDSFYDGLRSLPSNSLDDSYLYHEAIWVGISLGEAAIERLIADEKEVFNPMLHSLIEDRLSLGISWNDYFRRYAPFLNVPNWLDKVWRPIIAEDLKHNDNSSYLDWFNEQKSIASLLHQIREDSRSFQSLIQPYELIGIFAVKPQNINPRISNQSGAFLLFGMGLHSDKDGGDSWGPLYCKKSSDAEIPPKWIERCFRVPADKKEKIQKELARINIVSSHIYPEMDKYAKELKKTYKLE